MWSVVLVYRLIIPQDVSFIIYFNVSFTIFGVSEQEKPGWRDVQGFDGKTWGKKSIYHIEVRWVYIIKIDNLYRCTVHIYINVYVHQLMHVFISPREPWNLLKIHTKMLLHVSVYDHHQGARTWTYLKLQLLKFR